jgi:hypothetical protein
MATQVQLEITVDEAGAVQGIRAFDTQLKKIGNDAQDAGKKSSKGFQEVGKEIHRSHQAAQLFFQTTGVQLPRAIENLVAKSPGMSKAFGAGFSTIAVVAMIAEAGKLARNFDKIKASTLDIGDSIRAVFDHKFLDQLRAKEVAKELEGVKDVVFGINQAAAVAGKEGFGQITQELNNSKAALDELTRKFKLEVEDKFHAGTSASKSLMSSAADEVNKAKARLDEKAKADEEKLTVQHETALRHIRLESELAGKSDVERVRLQLKADIEDLDDRRDLKDPEERNRIRVQIEKKAAADIMEIRRKYSEDIQQRITDEQGGGLEGFAKIQFEAKQKVAEIEKQYRDIFDKVHLDPSDPNYQQELDAIVNAEADKMRAIGAVQAAALKEQQKLMRDLTVQLGDDLENLLNGNIGDNIKKEFKKLGFQMIASMILGMKGAAAGYQQGSQMGTPLIGLLTGILGIGGGGGTYGSPGAGGSSGGTAQYPGTPPFVANNFFGGNGGFGAGSGGAYGGSSSGGGAGGGLLGLGGTALGNGGVQKALQNFILKHPKIASGIGGALVGGYVGYQTGSKTWGTLSGAGTGALTGFMLGGPIGALIGGAAGAIAGFFGGLLGGNKNRHQAQKIVDALFPQMQQIQDQYKGFQLDYASALAQLEQLKAQAFPQLDKLGGEGRKYERAMMPYFDQARRNIDNLETERQRRASINFGIPQFAVGGTVRRTGMFMAHGGEEVINSKDSARERGTLKRINAGLPAGGSSGGGPMIVIENLHAMDAKSFEKWLDDGAIKVVHRSSARAQLEGRR